MIRGQIWPVAGSVHAAKPRPAVVIQDDRFDATDSGTVLPVNSIEINAPLSRSRIGADEVSGLTVQSFVMINKLTTGHRMNVGQHIGQLTRTQLVDLGRLAMAYLGLAN